MEKYNLTQTGQEVQDILDNATPQSDLAAEVERAQEAERLLGEGIQQNADDIDAIEGKIPSAATSENKLATESYVNDAVATSSATFRGTFNLVSDLSLTVDATEQQIATALAGAISTADNNDYAFVQIPTSDETPTEIAEIDRYKFNGTAWSFEYKMNNSGFTEAQWEAINSGITSELVTKLGNLPTAAALAEALASKQNVLTFDSVPTEGSNNPVKSGGVYSAIDEEKGARLNSDAALQQSIEAILLLIPTAASSLNQLADKAFVNSSISTATATFRGTFNLVNDLHLTLAATHAQIGNALALAILESDNNDYAFVQIPTVETAPNEIAQTDRYKFNGSTWEYEYTLNNSGFTSAQWTAINSGITSALVSKLSALPTNADLTTALGVLTSSITTINQKIPSAASQANQLVDTAAMESYIVQVLDVLTASFNVTSSDGHVTVQISQVDGKITSFALTTLDIASAASLSLVEGRVTTAEGNISTNSADIAILQDAYAALTQSALVVIAPTDTWPVARPATSTIYRVVDRVNTPPQYYSDYMWNGTTMVLMATYDNAIDPRPKKASQNLVTSGGVFDNMGALDVSELNATENPHTLAQYVDLSAALAAIPTDYQKGGMSIKFVQSPDNKYVQYRYMITDVTTAGRFTNTANWQGVDTEPKYNSQNFIESGGVRNAIAEAVGEELKPFSIVNGSQGNAGNLWVITLRGTTTKAIPVTAGHKYQLNIKKPTVSGFNWYWRIITYTTDDPTTLTTDRVVRVWINNWDHYSTNGDYIEIGTTEKGLTIQLTELTEAGAAQTSETCIPLRASDFSAGDIELIDITNNIERRVKVLEEEIPEINDGITSIEQNINETDKRIWINKFIGDNNNFSSTILYGLTPGREYKIILKDPNFDRTGVTVTSGLFLFNVNNHYNGVNTVLCGSAVPYSPESEYNFTVPSDSDYIKVGGRATKGTEVLFYIVDVTAIHSELKYTKEGVITIINGSSGIKATSHWSYFTFDNTYTNGVYVKFKNEFVLMYNGIYKAYTLGLIDTELNKTRETSPNGLSDSYYFENNTALCFNLVSKTLVIRNIRGETNIVEGLDYPLFYIVNGETVCLGNAISDRIIQNNKYFSDALFTSLNGKVILFRNGTPGNDGNTDCVTSYYFPVLGNNKVRIETNRPNTPGYNYVFGVSSVTDYRNIGRNPVFGINTIGSYAAIQSISVTAYNNICDIPNNVVAINIVIGESDGTSLHPLRIQDFDGYDVKAILYNSKEDIPVIQRNIDKVPMLINACRFHKNSLSSKDYQALICTDSHGWNLGNINAVQAVNGFSTIDAYVHCGDITGSNYNIEQITAFQTQIAALTKPGYIVCGNHDVGNAFYVGVCCNHEQAYNAYIKPMVDKGWLVSGEYEVGKPYWFHDNTIYKIRIIGLYEYDDNLDLDETYWKAVEYDSNLSIIQYNTSYNVGDKVNVHNEYTEHSFECVQAVTTPANYYTNPQYLPSYKVQRGSRVIRQTQAQWFLDKLASTPANYGVLVITHNPFSDTAISLDKKFSWPANIQGISWTQTSMTTNLIKNAIAAFKAGSNYSEKVVMKGNAAYLNVLNDGAIDYAYEVSKDFSAKNSGVYLLGLLGGHCHRDIIWKDGDIYQVSPNCAMVDAANDRNGDVRRTRTDELSADSLTVVSMASGRFGLVKIGVNVTENGTFRDFEVIDTTT